MRKAIKKSEDIEWKAIDDETIIFSPHKGKFFKLNPVGTFLWKLIDSNKNSYEELVSKVTIEFDVTKSAAEEDVKRFLDQLKNKELIKC